MIFMLNRKQIVARFGLVTLVGSAWLFTAAAVGMCSSLLSTIRIEAPNWWFDIGFIAPSIPLLSAFVLMLWLQREAAWRFVATVGAALSLLFCFVGAHTLWWLVTRLTFADLLPTFARVASPWLWQEILLADVALTLSLISLWVCVRAARRVDESAQRQTALVS